MVDLERLSFFTPLRFYQQQNRKNVEITIKKSALAANGQGSQGRIGIKIRASKWQMKWICYDPAEMFSALLFWWALVNICMDQLKGNSSGLGIYLQELIKNGKIFD